MGLSNLIVKSLVWSARKLERFAAGFCASANLDATNKGVKIGALVAAAVVVWVIVCLALALLLAALPLSIPEVFILGLLCAFVVWGGLLVAVLGTVSTKPASSGDRSA